MKLKPELILRLSAALAVILGLGWTAGNLWQAGRYQTKKKAKHAALVQLQEMKRQNDALAAALVALAAVTNSAPDLAALAARTVPGAAPAIREIETRALERGWQAKKTEVIFREVNLNLIADFLRAAETQRPPWRLAECVITSSAKSDGCGNATLTLETVARPAAE